MSHSRYALYLAPPPDGDLWRFGCDVIGRDALTGRSVDGFAPEGHDVEGWRGLTSEPRRYGFHATLTAPFRLRADLDFVDLMDRVAAFARHCSPFDAGELHVGEMKTADGRAFVVLKPKGGATELRVFEERAVRALDALRAPLTTAERLRRNVARLTPRQRYYLEAWGYPYVLDVRIVDERDWDIDRIAELAGEHPVLELVSLQLQHRDIEGACHHSGRID